MHTAKEKEKLSRETMRAMICSSVDRNFQASTERSSGSCICSVKSFVEAALRRPNQITFDWRLLRLV